jgi:hypothetical protein
VSARRNCREAEDWALRTAITPLSILTCKRYTSDMETVVRNVGDLNPGDRLAMERVIGQPLGETQRLVIQVVPLESAMPHLQPGDELHDLPEWTDVYNGLTDKEIDDLDAAIRERSNLSRSADGFA